MLRNGRQSLILWGAAGFLLIGVFCALAVYTRRAEPPLRKQSEGPTNQIGTAADAKHGSGDATPSELSLGDQETFPVVDGVPTDEDMEMLYEVLPSEGDVPALLDMIYESWEVDLPFDDANSFSPGIERIPVEAGSATKEQVKTLQDALARVTWALGTSDSVAYLKLLRESGETVAPEAYNIIREALLQEHRLRESEIPADGWSLLSKYTETAGYNSAWQGLITGHSEIRVFAAHTDRLEQPYQALQEIRRAVTVFRHVTNPPVPFAETIRKKGPVQVADVLLYVAHNDNKGGIVRPYAIRFWLDPTNDVWRPLALRAFQNPNEHFDVKILF
jgi:hypothetical protein